jgi:uncharacterized membrane protein HdeD (DUF308 family)
MKGEQMIRTLTRNWWIFIIRGLFAIIFGVLALMWPELTLFALVWLFGAYVLADGVFQVYSAISRREDFDRWWLILLEGLFGIVFGVLTFAWPGITGLVLLILIAAWAFLTGMLEISAAIQLRKEIENEWLLAFSGVISIMLGVLMMIWPAASAVALAFMIGIYAILFGATLILLGFRLKNMNPESNPLMNPS